MPLEAPQACAAVSPIHWTAEIERVDEAPGCVDRGLATICDLLTIEDGNELSGPWGRSAFRCRQAGARERPARPQGREPGRRALAHAPEQSRAPRSVPVYPQVARG